MSDQAISPETEKRYRRVYNRLEQIANAAGPQGEPDEFPHGRVVDAFLSERINWSAGMYRFRRAAVLHVLDAAIQNSEVLAPYLAKRRLLGTIEPHKDPLSHFGSHEEQSAGIAQERAFWARWKIRQNQRAQHTPNAQRSRHLVLQEALSGSRCKWGADTLRWYKVALLTGVAPNEWPGTTWVDCGRNRFALCVSKSSKPDRIAEFVLLDRLTPQQLALIHAHLDAATAKAQCGEFEAWYDACRTLLRTQAQEFWPTKEDLPTLHPKRHLFANVPGEPMNEQELSSIA